MKTVFNKQKLRKKKLFENLNQKVNSLHNSFPKSSKL